MSTLPAVHVSRKAVDRIASGHPWIFSSDVTDTGAAKAGDVVRMHGPKGRPLGTAHYSASSQIALRLLSRKSDIIDAAYLQDRIEAALKLRKRVVCDSNAFRLIHAEGDLLPGLVVDKYGSYLVLQLLTQGMDRLAPQICDALRAVFPDVQGMIARNDVPVREKEELSLETKVLFGDMPARVLIEMNGLKWSADLVSGQKTGVFLDQRENYVAAQRYANGRALDCFTATGGFAMHFASRCTHIEAVDSSAPSLAIAKENAEANGSENIAFRQADVLEYLPAQVTARRSFDIVVVDPPAFTKSRGAIEGAARGYKEINLRALRLLSPGGILVSCSCSFHMSEGRLLEIIAAAALDAGKQLRILERRTQAQDHPILLTVPETHYLKCIICEVVEAV